jgi:L-ascorbate metabolism protein UlaG (beta-lactamase superfamily)
VALVSHGHYDHLDTFTLSALRTPHRTRVITPLGNDAAILATDSSTAVETHDWGARIELSRDVAVTLAPMRHWSARGIADRNKALWASFVIDTPVGRVYHVGMSALANRAFVKMNGLGNEIVVVDMRDKPQPSAEEARAAAARRARPTIR